MLALLKVLSLLETRLKALRARPRPWELWMIILVGEFGWLCAFASNTGST